MSHLRSGFSGVSVPIGADGSSHNNITNNVVIKTQSKEKLPTDVKEVSDGVFVVYPNKKSENEEENPYSNLPSRDLASAQARLDQIKAQQPDNEKIIKALSLIIDILYNNPLYVNRFIVAQAVCLKELVKILTDADDVEITLQDPTCECGCSAKSDKIATIDSIYVKKNNNVVEFKYAYAEAKQILESNHISMKLVSLA